MRLIDADNYKDVLYAKRNNPSIRNGIASAITMLGKQETIDAVPVVHGRWLYDEVEMEYCCSECFQNAPIGMSSYILGKYCPNCGAKMKDGEGNG